MQLDPRTPVIVGVGQISHRTDQGADPLQPTELMAEALRRAEADCGAMGLLAGLDSIRVTRTLSWRYRNPGALVAEHLGVEIAHSEHARGGGNTPQALLNAAATDLLAGRADAVAICGGEAWRTRMDHYKRGDKPNWFSQDDSVPEAETNGDEMEMSFADERDIGIVMPVHMYPIFENAHRGHLGSSADAHLATISKLWAGFAAVAADNPYAWDRSAPTAEALATASKSNRPISFPYLKRFNSNNMVEQGAAVVLCTVERAEALGVARDRWVFPQSGGAGAEPVVSKRGAIHRAPAMAAAGRAAMAAAGCDVDDIAHLDIYSCFPSAVQIGTSELGIGLDRQLTVTGGLSFAGGPWNNYVTHAIASMVNTLRNDAGSRGLVWGNGGFISKHGFGVYSTEPPAQPFRVAESAPDPSESVERTPVANHEGPVTVESYTVMYDRDSAPEAGYVAATVGTAGRTWLHTTDAAVCQELLEADPLGHTVTRSADGVLTGLG
jgi:acetyl-CoA C-acetyltransferase